MHSALLVIEKPDLSNPEKEKAWTDLKKALSGILATYERIEMLSENVLMIPMQSALPTFGDLIHAAQGKELSYRVLFFDQEPQWVYSKPRQS